MDSSDRTKTCGAPWCNRSTETPLGSNRPKSSCCRKIGNVIVCRPCYQYVWEQSQLLGRGMLEIFLTLPPPQRVLPRVKTTCARNGCTVTFAEGEKSGNRRHIGLYHVCRPCYETAWEVARAKGISIEEAYKQLPPKGWHKNRPPKYQVVKCCLPWCEYETKNKPEALVSEGLYACGKCRLHLSYLQRRFTHIVRSWQEWAIEAIRGNVVKPGAAEQCAMPWCKACEKPRACGPKGEPICNTDSAYLYLYARRKGITVDEAFATAPPPNKNGRTRSANWPTPVS